MALRLLVSVRCADAGTAHTGCGALPSPVLPPEPAALGPPLIRLSCLAEEYEVSDEWRPRCPWPCALPWLCW